jgi:glutathione synthase/RimK-type ligase-like ATP-grasp enzyme
MKQILVIGSLNTETSETRAISETASFVKQAIEQYGQHTADVFFCHLDDLGYVVKGIGDHMMIDIRNSRDLAEYDLVILRGKLAANINLVSTASQYLHLKGIAHVNTAYGSRRAIGKVPQLYNMAELGMPVPYTVSAQAKYLPSLLEEHLTYPVVVKDVKGAHGSHNYLVNNRDELDQILSKNQDITFMAQQFIPNQGDYRVLIVGDAVTLIHRQSQGESHLNNTSVGGKATLLEASALDPKIIEQSKRFAEFCGYEIAGVDVIQSQENGAHYFLEINSQPQLQTGAFVDEKQAMVGKYFSQLLDGSA